MMNSRARETLKEAVAEGMTIQDGRLELVKESSFDLANRDARNAAAGCPNSACAVLSCK